MGYGRPQPQHAGAGPLRDGRWGVVGPRYPISDLRSPAAEAALADRVREVGGYPPLRLARGAEALWRADPIFQFATEEERFCGLKTSAIDF
jgi:hypothetical protein